jgi:hypothetical protein
MQGNCSKRHRSVPKHFYGNRTCVIQTPQPFLHITGFAARVLLENLAIVAMPQTRPITTAGHGSVTSVTSGGANAPKRLFCSLRRVFLALKMVQKWLKLRWFDYVHGIGASRVGDACHPGAPVSQGALKAAPEGALMISDSESGKLRLRNVAFVGSEAACVRGLYLNAKSHVVMQGKMASHGTVGLLVQAVYVLPMLLLY